MSLNPKTLQATKPLPYSGTPVTTGDHLKKRMLKLGLCQRGLAKQLGVREWTLRHWETNATVTAIRIVPRIIGFLEYDPNPESSDLAQGIQWARRRQDLSLRGLAKQLGVDPETLRRWEHGIGIPHGKHLALVERFV